jgi:2-methylisocitrate lyase-like PEP mutase family enzyme
MPMSALMEFFVPGLNDLALIEKLVQLSPLPANLMVTRGVPEIADLARVVVRRTSLGPWPTMAVMRVIGAGRRRGRGETAWTELAPRSFVPAPKMAPERVFDSRGR